MRKLIINITLLIAIIVAVSIFMNWILYPHMGLTPWWWGSELMEQKRNILDRDRGKFNTLFIGSSRVYRQINPSIIDSVTGKTRSFNFGINWLFAPESFFVYNRITGEDKMKFDFVVIELSKIRSVDFSNLHTTRTIYWYDRQLYFLAIKATWNSNFSFNEKLYLSGIHSISYIDNLLNLGYLTAAMEFKKNSAGNMARDGNGFELLSTEVKNNQLAAKEENAQGRNALFLQDTSVVTKRIEISSGKFEKYDESPDQLKNYNKYYAKYLNEMITDALENGTHLIFLLSPRIDASQYDELIPLYHQILPAHRIEISDARKYPELYLAEFSFDETHFNKLGSVRYSLILGEKMKALMRDK